VAVHGGAVIKEAADSPAAARDIDTVLEREAATDVGDAGAGKGELASEMDSGAGVFTPASNRKRTEAARLEAEKMAMECPSGPGAAAPPTIAAAMPSTEKGIAQQADVAMHVAMEPAAQVVAGVVEVSFDHTTQDAAEGPALSSAGPSTSAADWIGRLPAEWGLGVILGPTGSGKTQVEGGSVPILSLPPRPIPQAAG
jgi:hypothetical protein